MTDQKNQEVLPEQQEAQEIQFSNHISDDRFDELIGGAGPQMTQAEFDYLRSVPLEVDADSAFTMVCSAFARSRSIANDRELCPGQTVRYGSRGGDLGMITSYPYKTEGIIKDGIHWTIDVHFFGKREAEPVDPNSLTVIEVTEDND